MAEIQFDFNTMPITKDITLKAKWDCPPAYVTFEYADGTKDEYYDLEQFLLSIYNTGGVRYPKANCTKVIFAPECANIVLPNNNNYSYSFAYTIPKHILAGSKDTLREFRGAEYLNFSNWTWLGSYNGFDSFPNLEVFTGMPRGTEVLRTNFLSNCPKLNSPMILNCATIQNNVLAGCTSLNSPITFIPRDYDISVYDNFMDGCTSFNSELIIQNSPSSDNSKLNVWPGFMHNCDNFSGTLDSNKVRYWDATSTNEDTTTFSTDNNSAPLYTKGVTIELGDNDSSRVWATRCPNLSDNPYRNLHVIYKNYGGMVNDETGEVTKYFTPEDVQKVLTGLTYSNYVSGLPVPNTSGKYYFQLGPDVAELDITEVGSLCGCMSYDNYNNGQPFQFLVKGMEYLTKVKALPDNFYGGSNKWNKDLQNYEYIMQLPPNLEVIGDNCFYKITAPFNGIIYGIEIPESVTTIGDNFIVDMKSRFQVLKINTPHTPTNPETCLHGPAIFTLTGPHAQTWYDAMPPTMDPGASSRRYTVASE